MIKSLVLGSTALTLLALAPNMAAAKALTAGEWSLGGVQDICLESDGEWYYTTFSGLPGGWEATGYKDVQTILYGGTYFSGAGEDSITVNGKKDAFWMEFGNSGDTLYNTHDKLPITFISKTCSAPLHNGGHEKLPPMLSKQHD